MEQFVLTDHPHRRYNPLLDEWILVSPQRAKRPWQGQNEAISDEKKPEYDETCYLCPGNDRINGGTNPKYKNCYVFDLQFKQESKKILLDSIKEEDQDTFITEAKKYFQESEINVQELYSEIEKTFIRKLKR